MSDTIVITVVVKGPKPPKRALYRALLSATMIGGTIMMEALRGSPKFLFRGCISAGEMKESSDFLIGPAVDEAAGGFERAHGPFLWLSSSALDITSRYAETYGDRLEPNIVIPYSVPMNDGSKIKTHAFNYFISDEDSDRRVALRRNILEAFGPEPFMSDVRAKRRNTVSFLNRLDRLAISGDLRRREFVWRLPDWEDLSTDQRLQIAARGIHWKNGVMTSDFSDI